MLQCYWFCSHLCSILPHIPSILYPKVFLIGIKDFSEKKKKINSSALSFLYSPTLTFIHDHWKNHSLDQKDHCWQSNVSAF